MKINTICICGAGTMGSGIAQVVAMHGYNTIQFDVNEAVLLNSKKTISLNLEKLQSKGLLSTTALSEVLDKLKFTANIKECQADLFIEAIIENETAKVDLFNTIATFNSKEVILATNTSSLVIGNIAAKVLHPERVIGMHFFNPAFIMKLVEVVTTSQTGRHVAAAVFDLAKTLGKTPVMCKDAPGFIVNRVARQYYLEAMKLVESGVADISTVDEIMEATGFKMGPFALMDLIGMDINYTASCGVYEALGRPERLRPSHLQHQKVANGYLGRKTAKGFYDY